MTRWWLGLCGALALTACSEDPENAPGTDDTGVSVDGGAGGSDGGPRDDRGVGDDGVSEDAAPPRDGTVRPDGSVQPITSCTEACNQLAACEQLGQFGSYDSCLDACTASDTINDLSNFYACIEGEACNLVGRCRLPDPPEPPELTCAEACAQIGTCGLDLPGFDTDCEARCEAFDRRAQLLACAAPQVQICAPATFNTCLAEQVFPACGNRCAASVACNIELADSCVSDCVAAGLDADPLRRLRQSQRNTCVNTSANNCERINACIVPSQEPQIIDEVTFCRRFSGCGFDDFISCDEFVNGFVEEQDRANFLTCVYAQLEVCPRDPFESIDACFRNPGNGNAAACGDWCAARDVCGSLPEGEDRFRCTSGCAEALQGSPDDAARQVAQLACGRAESCPDLARCEAGLDTTPVCAAHCAALDGCGLADAGCEATCSAQFYRARQGAVRACVAGAACPAMPACLSAEPASCRARCAVSAPCGLEANGGQGDQEAACIARCDDADFADHAATQRLNACYISAPICYANNIDQVPSAQACSAGRLLSGQACLGWCRLQNGCVEDDAALTACLGTCADALPGDDAAAVWLGRDCLTAQAQGTCAALGACLTSDAGACDAHCEAVSGCGLDRPDCDVSCAGDALAEVRANLDAPCLDAAGNDCAAAALCISGEAGVEAPVDSSLANYCALHNGCGFANEFPCEELYDILQREAGPDGQSAIICAVRLFESGCPNDPFEAFNRCLEGNNVDPRAGACLDLCAARNVCNDLPGGRLACERSCVVAFAGGYDGGGGFDGEAGGPGEPPPDFDGADAPDIDIPIGGGGGDGGGGGGGGGDPVARALGAELPCRFAFTCDDLAECRATSAPEQQCARFCSARAACGEVADQASCAVDCDARFDRARDTAWRACVQRAGDDCQALEACTPAAPPNCAAYCQRQFECGFANGDCEATCDDQAFVNPTDVAVRVQCAISAVGCYDEGQGGQPATVDQCIFAAIDQLVPADCRAWCRAVEDCGDGSARGLAGCISECVQGDFADPQEELRLGAARGCLVGLGANAACGALQACVPPTAEVSCVAHCAAVSYCNIETEVDCMTACEGDNPPSAEVSACVVGASRTGRGCVPVAACLGFVAPPAQAECVAYCAEARRCNVGLDDFACRLGCDADPLVNATRRACREASSCPNAAACDALGGMPVAACVAPCAALGACGFGSAALCGAACTGNRASVDTNAAADAELLVCLGDAAGPRCQAETVEGCFDRTGPLCLQACNLLGQCGFADPGPECLQGCQDAADSGDPTGQPPFLQCIIDGLGNNCDEAIFDRCFQF